MVDQQTVRCVIIGGGGHACSVIDTIQMMGTVSIFGVTDVNPDRWGQQLYGVPIVGNDDWLPKAQQHQVGHFVMGIGGTDDNGPRRRLYEQACQLGLIPLTVVHPTAFVSSRATLGQGVQVLANAVINAGAVLGDDIIVNSGAVIEHHCTIGNHVHIASGACLTGGVRIDAHAHIGAGAAVRQSVHIGESVIVGMGAVVLHDVEPYTTVVGVPAKPIRVSPKSSQTF